MQNITDEAIDAADLWGGQLSRSDLTDALENAQPLILGPELTDLRERFDRADRTLRSDASDAVGDRRAHLQSKAEGVRLCMSYLDEIARTL
jgi:hypothetical protein